MSERVGASPCAASTPSVICSTATAPIGPAGVSNAMPCAAVTRLLSTSGAISFLTRAAKRLPSSNSRDYGRGFADIFKQADFDFYKIDGALFAPAEVWVSNLDTGNTWHGGALNMGLLRELWCQEA